MIRLATYVAFALVLLAIVPGGLVLLREAYRRWGAKRASKQFAAVRRMVEAHLLQPFSQRGSLQELARALEQGFERPTIEQTLEGLLHERVQDAWLCALVDALGLAEQYIRRLRHASRWSERAHAAEMLGLMGIAAACPALIAVLRDPYEDGTVKNASIDALGKLKDKSTIPFLVQELREIDEAASPIVADALASFGHDAVQALIPLVTSDERPVVRAWAARILGRIGDIAALEPLLIGLQDGQEQVRLAVAEALGTLRDAQAVRALLEVTLRDPGGRVRAQAASSLGLIGHEEAAEGLTAALGDSNFATRIRALEALELIRPQSTLALERALRDPNPEVTRRAALALERVGYVAARVEELASEDPVIFQRAYAAVVELGRTGIVDSLARHIHHKNPQIRASIATACGELGSLRLGKVLLEATRDEVGLVRARAAEALGRLRAEGAPNALIKLLDDPEMMVRKNATKALTSYSGSHFQAFVPNIMAAYGSSTPSVRTHAVELIAKMGTANKVEILIRTADDPCEEVRVLSVEALANHTEQLSVEWLASRLADPSAEVRMAAVDALDAIQGEEKIELLFRMLPGAEPMVRDRIAEALARNALSVLRTHIEKLLQQSDVDVRLGITWTLGKTGDPESLSLLATLLRDPEPKVRASAAGALGKIQVAKASEILLGAIEDPDPKTRAAVINSIGKLPFSTELAVTKLQNRLRDPDSFVRNRAALALGRLGGNQAEQALLRIDRTSPVEVAVKTVALALVGTDKGLELATEALTTPALWSEVQLLLQREEVLVRQAFYERMGLEEGRISHDQEAVEAHYRERLRTSQDAEQRRRAADALSRLRTVSSLRALADALATDPVAEVRVRAAQALADRGNELLAQEALCRAVFDPSYEVMRLAVRALGATRNRPAGEALLQLLGAVSEELQTEIEQALAQIYSDEPLILAEQIGSLERPELVATGLRVLEHMRHPLLLQPLLKFAKSPVPLLRAAAIRALAALPSSEATAKLREALGDTNSLVRLAAVEAIARQADPVTPSLLRPLLIDPAVAVRRKIADIADTFEPSQAIEMLTVLVEDPSVEVCAAALVSLLSLGTLEGLQHFVRLWPKVSQLVVQQTRTDARASALAQHLAACISSDPNPQMREGAVAGLAALATRGFEQHLLFALNDPVASVRLATLRTLQALDHVGVRQHIAQLLHDPNGEVREAAASLQRPASGRPQGSSIVH